MAGPYLAGPGREVVVRAEFEQTRMEQNLIAAPLEHDRAQVVVENDARLAVPSLKGAYVSA
jgi:hypothetical protein